LFLSHKWRKSRQRYKKNQRPFGGRTLNEPELSGALFTCSDDDDNDLFKVAAHNMISDVDKMSINA